jgi:hypothetical protein
MLHAGTQTWWQNCIELRWAKGGQYVLENRRLIIGYLIKIQLNSFLSPLYILNKQNKLRGLQPGSELYRLIDRHLLAKFIADFCGLRGVEWSARRIPPN